MIDYNSLTDEEFDELMELEAIDIEVIQDFYKIPNPYDDVNYEGSPSIF